MNEQQKYEIVISGAKTDKSQLKALTRENITPFIHRREKIIRSYEIENPRKTLTFAISEAKKHIIKTLAGAGITLQKKDIPDLVLVNSDDQTKLEQALEAVGGASYEGVSGTAGVLNGVSIVFIRNDITDLDNANIIFHEMYHSTGIQIIVANEEVVKPGRQGFEIFALKPEYKSWLMEEGLVVYESAKFAKMLFSNEMFAGDVSKRELKINGMQERRVIIDGRISFGNGIKIEPDYCSLLPREPIEQTSFGMRGAASLAGSLFELLLSRFSEDERDEFLNLARRARIKLELIPEMVKVLNDKWEHGIYSKILKCQRTDQAVWSLIQNLRSSSAKIE